MSTKEQIHVELTDEQIQEAIDASTLENPLGHIERVWDFMVGGSFADHAHPVNVRDYSMPAKQACHIANEVMAKLPAEIRATVAMEWVNLAPSSVS